MDNVTIAFIILFVSMFGSSMIQAKSLKDLDQDKKVTLIELFSKSRFYFLGILLAILLLFFCSIKFQWLAPSIAASIYIVVLVLYFIASSYLAYKKLKEHGFSDVYIRSYLLSSGLRLVGLSIFLLLVNF